MIRFKVGIRQCGSTWCRCLFAVAIMLMCGVGASFTCHAVSYVISSPERAIDSLDIYLNNHDVFLSRELASIETVGSSLEDAGSTDSVKIQIDLGEVYRRFDIDPSVLSYQRTYTEENDSLVSWLYGLVVMLGIVALGLVLLLVAYRSSHKKLDKYKGRLVANNVLKDEYIRKILDLCSSYMARLEDLNTLIIRKMKTGQSADLERLAESGDFVREQTERFLKSFDETYLDTYPDFISDLNKLLRPEERFETPTGKHLTPELRIAAFMRLGIDDGARISRFLGLSLNTIYTYRNKLKNRAANRDDFEVQIKNIGVFN